jgi:hypothetical protein
MRTRYWETSLRRNTCFIFLCTKLSLCFYGALRHEDVLGEWRYSSSNSLISALDGGEWSASRLGRFTPRERAPGTRWIGGWVGPRAVLDAVAKRKIPAPAGNRTLEPRSFSLYTIINYFFRHYRTAVTYVFVLHLRKPVTRNSQLHTLFLIPILTEGVLWEWRCSLTHSVTSALDGGEW